MKMSEPPEVSIPEILGQIDGILKRRRDANNHRSPQPVSDPASAFMMTHALGQARGTTVLALEFADGIIAAGDRLTVEGYGSVFSRDTVKLVDVETNAVLACCGYSSFAQDVEEDLCHICNIISSKIKRPVSLEGKCNLLTDIIKANATMPPWYAFLWLPFGAILAGYDRHSGKKIYALDSTGGKYQFDWYFADGSGGKSAKTYLIQNFQRNMKWEDAVGIAIGAIRAAGMTETTVSHPTGDPPPTVKIITKNGITTLSEREIEKYCTQLFRSEEKYLNANLQTQRTKGGL